MRLGALIAYVAGMAILLGLGLWQLHRLAWKEALLAEISGQRAMPPVMVEAGPDLEGLHPWQRVEVRGQVAAAPLALGPRTYRGAAGVHVMTPLRLSDGMILFVDRGWVPALSGRAAGEDQVLLVEGVVRKPLRGWMTPENDVAGGVWYWPDISAMQRFLFGEDLPPAQVYIQADRETGAVGDLLPVAVPVTVDAIRNNHAQYAAFWFAMAGVLTVLALFARRLSLKGEIK